MIAHRTHSVIRLLALVVPIAALAAVSMAVNFATPQDEEDYYYRQANGHYDVVWMKGLVDDYQNSLITNADFVNELEENRYTLKATLDAKHGIINACYLLDLVMAQSNGIIGYDGSTPVFFDNAQYLDSQGQVLPGKARDYNTAVRANSILNAVIASWSGHTCVDVMVTNRCCTQSSSPSQPVENCNTVATNKSCTLDSYDLCTTGSHQCGG